MSDKTIHTIGRLLAAMIMAPPILLLILYVQSSSPPIEYGPIQEIIPPVVHPGQSVYIVRDLHIKRPCNLTIIRNFERKLPDGSTEVIEGLDIKVAYEPRRFLQRRILEIPYNMPPGRWTLKNQLIYDEWIFRHSFLAAPIHFTVVKP